MSLPVIQNPFDTYIGLDGLTLNGGDVYIGTAGMDPQTNPQSVFWDAAGLIPATQPLETLGGYIMFGGSPARAYTAATYSMRVRDRAGNQVFYEPNMSDVSGRPSVIDWGATGNGVTDDTAAVQSALTATAAAGQSLYFPAGHYRLTASISAPGSVNCYGDGQGETYLDWDSTATTSGFEITLAATGGFSQFAQFTDMVLTTERTADRAITVSSPTTGGDRISPRVVLDRVLIRGATNPTVDGWIIGADFDGCPNVYVNNCTIIGKVNVADPNYTSTAGILYHTDNGATPHATGITVTDSFFGSLQVGLQLLNFEGAILTGNNFLGTNRAILADGQPAPYSGIQILGNYMTSSGVCIDIVQMNAAVIVGNYINPGYDQAGATGIAIEGASGYCLIEGNFYENSNATVPSTAVTIDNSIHCIISGNLFKRCDSASLVGGTGVHLTATASGTTVTDTNIYDFTAVQVLDQGTGNIVAKAVKANPGASRTNLGVESKYGSSVVTLNASGVGTVTFAAPFVTALHSVVASSGDHTIAGGANPAISFAASDKNLFTFVVIPNPGAISYRINWVAYGA